MNRVRRGTLDGIPRLFAPERAERPNAFADAGAAPGSAATGAERDDCPFCPGREAMTPPEVLRVDGPDGWLVRVFPNKFPAAAMHEVIVESPRHDAAFHHLESASDVISVYLDRFRALSTMPEVEFVALFKNQGAAGGASISHLHSQMLGVPFLPPRIARERTAFMNASRCPLCHPSDAVPIAENDSFRWVAPAAAEFAHQQWVIPKRHHPEFGAVTEDEIPQLAKLLQSVASAMARISPGYNWLFMSFPRTPSAHWYIDIVPRLTTIAGFELQSGSAIQITDASETASLMRGHASDPR